MTHVQIGCKGIEFDSPYSDGQAITRLQDLIEDRTLKSDFAYSLVQQVDRRKLSPIQVLWVHVLVAGADHRPTRPTREAFTIEGLEPIVEHMQFATALRSDGGRGLKYPRIDMVQDGQPVIFKLAGPNSKYHGDVAVSSSAKYGCGEFYGYISQGGVFTFRKGRVPHVEALPHRFAADPAGTVAAIGRETGRCCYCHQELADERSKMAGYGPQCGAHYNLPYPTMEDVRKAWLV